MQRLLLGLVIAVSLAWSAPETPSKNAKPPAQKGSAETSITGCIDQQGETYVLRELRTAGAVLNVKGKGFSDDNFARYVGHKVTVQGTIEKGSKTSVMHVSKVDDAGPGCSDK